MQTMKKQTPDADIVVRVPATEVSVYLERGWLPCPKKVWKRSSWATLKDMSGPSKRVRVDPLRERKQNAPTVATHARRKTLKAMEQAKKLFLEHLLLSPQTKTT